MISQIFNFSNAPQETLGTLLKEEESIRKVFARIAGASPDPFATPWVTRLANDSSGVVLDSFGTVLGSRGALDSIAIRLLERRRTPEIIAHLLTLYANSSEEIPSHLLAISPHELRLSHRALIAVLIRRDDPGSLRMLLDLRQNMDSTIRIELARAIHLRRDEFAWELAERFMGDRDFQVREAALNWLESRGDARAVSLLKKPLRSESSAAMAAESLTRLGQSVDREALNLLATSISVRDRKSAAFVLAASESEDLSLLSEVVSVDSSRKQEEGRPRSKGNL